MFTLSCKHVVHARHAGTTWLHDSVNIHRTCTSCKHVVPGRNTRCNNQSCRTIVNVSKPSQWYDKCTRSVECYWYSNDQTVHYKSNETVHFCCLDVWHTMHTTTQHTFLRMNECSYINAHSTTDKCQYRLPFELAGSEKILHFTILGGP